MSRREIITAALIAAAIFVAGCQGMDGMPQDMPVMGGGLTDIGNPNDEADQLNGKSIYVNEKYDVAIEYSDGWNVQERGLEEAIFSASENESITASFVTLEDGDSFEAFVNDVRGGMEDLHMVYAPRFDAALCADAADEETYDGMRSVECYYYREGPEMTFVMAFVGRVLSDSDAPEVLTKASTGKLKTMVAKQDGESEGGSEGDGGDQATVSVRDSYLKLAEGDEEGLVKMGSNVAVKPESSKPVGPQAFDPFNSHMHKHRPEPFDPYMDYLDAPYRW